MPGLVLAGPLVILLLVAVGATSAGAGAASGPAAALVAADEPSPSTSSSAIEPRARGVEAGPTTSKLVGVGLLGAGLAGLTVFFALTIAAGVREQRARPDERR